MPHSRLNLFVTPASVPLGNFVVAPANDKSFAPILLPNVIYVLPQGYAQKLKQFTRERGYSTEEHLGWFADWTNLEEVDHEDVKVRLFSQSLIGE